MAYPTEATRKPRRTHEHINLFEVGERVHTHKVQGEVLAFLGTTCERCTAGEPVQIFTVDIIDYDFGTVA